MQQLIFRYCSIQLRKFIKYIDVRRWTLFYWFIVFLEIELSLYLKDIFVKLIYYLKYIEKRDDDKFFNNIEKISTSTVFKIIYILYGYIALYYSYKKLIV